MKLSTPDLVPIFPSVSFSFLRLIFFSDFTKSFIPLWDLIVLKIIFFPSLLSQKVLNILSFLIFNEVKKKTFHFLLISLKFLRRYFAPFKLEHFILFLLHLSRSNSCLFKTAPNCRSEENPVYYAVILYFRLSLKGRGWH